MVSFVPLTIGIFSPSDAGHIGPIFLVAEALAKRGHELVFYVVDFQSEKLKPKFSQIGAKCVVLPTIFETEAEYRSAVRATGKTNFLSFRKVSLAPLLKALSEDRPSVLLADFMAVAGQEAAAKLGIPLVINLPGPASLASGIMGMTDPDTAISLGGVEIIRQRYTKFGKAMAMNAQGCGELFSMIRRHLGGSVVLINSWLGLEKPQPLPANWRLTGPMLPPVTTMVQDFERDHPKLAAWLQREGPPVVYITTGSLVQLKDWQVRVLYRGLKQAGLRAVWSLKEPQQAFLPKQEDPDLWVSGWLPQAELMQSDAVVGVLSHCGWGGALESMTAGKPVACLPFFADQPANAEILVRAGAGALCAPLPEFVQAIRNLYEPHSLTADGVAAALRSIVQDPNYSKAARQVQWLSGATKGVEGAAWEVEMAGSYGVEHHLAREQVRRQSGQNIWISTAAGATLAISMMMAISAVALQGRKRA